MSTESTPPSWHGPTRSSSTEAAFQEHAGRLVAETLRKSLRRAQLVVGLGVVLFCGFVLAAIFFNDTKSVVNRNGQELSGEILEILAGPPKQAKVAYKHDGNTIAFVSLKDAVREFKPGEKVQVSVDRDHPGRTVILGAAKRERVTSMPVAGLLVSSLLVFGIGVFDLQASLRCRKYLKGNTWRNLRWRGVVYGPGRGRVRAAGWLYDADANRPYFMVNALGCWRQGVDLLAEPCDLAVAGNPAGVVVVRHPATLRTVLLRPTRGERQRQRALSLLAAG